eukprot:UN33695
MREQDKHAKVLSDNECNIDNSNIYDIMTTNMDTDLKSDVNTPKRSSKFKYVSWSVRGWRAVVYHDRQQFNSGIWKNEISAVQAVNQKCLELGKPIPHPQYGFGSQNTEITSQSKKMLEQIQN